MGACIIMKKDREDGVGPLALALPLVVEKTGLAYLSCSPGGVGASLGGVRGQISGR